MMREFMNLVELSQNWFERGTPVKITAPGWDAAEFLEDDEFDLDWRLCFVPAGEVTPNLLDPEESNARIADIQKWAGTELFERLKERPPILLLKTGEILDGNHRTHVAQEAGLEFIPMLVGN